MERYRIRRMAERLAVKITQGRFEQELWNLAAIIEEHLLSEMVQLDQAEGRPKKPRHNPGRADPGKVKVL